MTPRASPQMEVTRPRGDVPGRKTPFYADVTTRSDTLDRLILFQLRFNRSTMWRDDCSRAHTGDASTDIRLRTVSKVIHGRAIFPYCTVASGRTFRVRLAMRAVTSGSSPQSSCIQWCRYGAALLCACRGRTSRPPVVWVDT